MNKKRVSVIALIVVVLCYGYFRQHDNSDSDPASSGITASSSSQSTTQTPEPSQEASSEVLSRLEAPYRLEDRKSDIIDHMGYALSYNSDYRVPNWVAYELRSTELLRSDLGRSDKFVPDPQIKGRQAYDSDYIHSGYDRGHMAPAGDMKWSTQAMQESFYLSNVCPQKHNLNSGAWNDLEKQVRTEARYYGTVWVVCGPIFDTNRPAHIGENHVMVPDRFFKALLARKKNAPGYVAIGFIFPNESCVRNLQNYCMSVDELEKELGMDLFFNLDTDEQEKAESKCDPYGDWRIRDEILRD